MSKATAKTVILALSGIVIASMFFSLIVQVYIITRTFEQPTGVSANAASPVAQTRFCINHPPTIAIDCNLTLTQNTSFFCAINGSDFDPNTSLNYTLVIENATRPFNITPASSVNVSALGIMNFIPSNDDVGNYTLLFTVNDGTGCANAQASMEALMIIQNINDAPYLKKPIPNQAIDVNTTLSAFLLSDYFADPDKDPLNYNNTPVSGLTIDILPTSEVRITSLVCLNEKRFVVFTATDPYNLSASSNSVEIEVKCKKSGGGSDGNTKQSGGGGGGGASICRPQWECDEWLSCLPTGFQWQHCYDLKGCEGEKYFKRNCSYQQSLPACQENWLCTPWGKCWLNGTQYRTCQDLQHCGTNVTQPPLAQGCVYQPTCNDGVQNGDEQGIDCGGALCPACAIVQEPGAVGKEGALNLWLVAIILISILLVSGVVRYYRAQIAQLLAVIGFMLKHRSYKDVLLDALQRKSFFERIRAYEQLLASDAGAAMSTAAIYESLSMLSRQYLAEALSLHEELNKAELEARCAALQLRPETVLLLRGLYMKIEIMEAEELELDMFFVAASIEELRTVICLTSEYERAELLRPVEEVPITQDMSFYDEIFARSINALRALQYEDLEGARAGYLALLEHYEALSEQEKESIYPELSWLYETIKFSSEMTGARVVKKDVVVSSSSAAA